MVFNSTSYQICEQIFLWLKYILFQLPALVSNIYLHMALQAFAHAVLSIQNTAYRRLRYTVSTGDTCILAFWWFNFCLCCILSFTTHSFVGVSFMCIPCHSFWECLTYRAFNYNVSHLEWIEHSWFQIFAFSPKRMQLVRLYGYTGDISNFCPQLLACVVNHIWAVDLTEPRYSVSHRLK